MMTEMDRPIGGDGNRGKFLSREHWIAALGTVGVLVLSCAGMLVGATLWIESTIRAVAEADLAAINAVVLGPPYRWPRWAAR